MTLAAKVNTLREPQSSPAQTVVFQLCAFRATLITSADVVRPPITRRPS